MTVESINDWKGSQRLSSEQIKEFYESHIDWLQDWNYSDIPIQDKYFLQTTEIENENGWNSRKCEIHTPHKRTGEMLIDQSVKIGEYERNYTHFAKKTFHPFHKDGQDYALYSPRYTCTRVMKLPECEDIGGEEPESNGFCPVEYFVPCKERQDNEYENLNADFGFVMGCVWGDDATWKVQFIDLENVSEGELERKPEKLGYHEAPRDIPLEDIVDLRFYDDFDRMISVASFRSFTVDDEMNFHHSYDGVDEEKIKEYKEFIESN